MRFSQTKEAETFVASGPSRETSPEIMEAIVFFARSEAEAEALWEGDGFGRVCHPTDLWEHVTNNGLRDPEEFVWGVTGSNWWEEIKDL